MKALNLLLILLVIFSTQVSAEEMTQEEFNNFCNAVPGSKLRAKGAKSLCSAKIDGKFLKWMYPNTVGDIEDWVDKELLEKIISASEARAPKENSIEPTKKKKWSVSLKPATPSPSKTVVPTKSKSSVAITPAQVEKNQSIQKDETANLAMSREEFVELCRSLPNARMAETTKVVGCNVSHRGKYIKWYFPHSIGDIANQIPLIIKEQEADLKQKELDLEKKRLEEQERIARLEADRAEYIRRKALSEKQARLDAIAEQERQIAEAKRQEELWEAKVNQIISEAKAEGRLYGFVPMNKPLTYILKDEVLGYKSKGKLSDRYRSNEILELREFAGLNWILRAACVSPDGCEPSPYETGQPKTNTIYWVKASSNSDPVCTDFDMFVDELLKYHSIVNENYKDYPIYKKMVSEKRRACSLYEKKLSSDDVDRIKQTLESKYELIDEDTYDSKYDNSLSVEKITYANKGDRIEFVRNYKSKFMGDGETTHLDITYISSEKLSYDKVIMERRSNNKKVKEKKAKSEQDSL